MLQAAWAHPRSLVACAALIAAGCTMCPDPYDYSGPVPNGSAPQNDFRARSHGILPIGAAPKPFPTIVEAEPKPKPAPAAPAGPDREPPPVMAEAEDDVLRLSAEEPAAVETAPEVPAADDVAADGLAPQALDPPAEVAPALGGEDAAAADGVVHRDAATVEQPAPAAAEGVSETVPESVPEPAAEPPLRETPGWRKRR